MSSGETGVIFDLGGVVLNSPFDAIADFERELGVAPNSVNEVIRAAGHDGAFARLERGDLTVGSFAPAFARDCDFAGMGSIDGHQLVLRICAACTPRPLMLDALHLLKTEPAVSTAALTNNFVFDSTSAFADATEEVRPLFDVVVESAVERLRKPDPAIYKLACERLGLQPAGCVFLDDIGRNLKPAAAMGMRTIKCAVEDRSGERALGALAQMLGGDVGRRLQQLLLRGRL